MRALFRKIWFWTTKRVSHVVGYVRGSIVLTLVADRRGRSPLLLGRTPKFVVRGVLTVGRNFRMRSNVSRSSIEVAPSGILEIGDDVFINQAANVYVESKVSIGARVDIGDNVRIYDTNFHAVRPGGVTAVEPISIEDDVWIAVNVTILPGVTIGRGSVIAAGTIVTKSVPAGSLVAGTMGSIVSSFEVPDDYRRRGPGSGADVENRARRSL